jgi:hypothetical protein
MRYLVVLSFIFSCCFLSAQGSWIKYAPIDNSFSVLFPGIPQERAKDLNTELGMLKTKNLSVALDKKDKNFLYSINIVTYPNATFTKDSTVYNDELLISNIDALSTNLKCKLVYKNKTTVSGEDAYLYRLTDDQSGQVVKGIVVIHQDAIYTLSVFTMIDRSLNDDIDKFLLSFGFKS